MVQITNYGFIIYTQVRMTKLLVMLSVAVRRIVWYMYILTSSCYNEAVICTLTILRWWNSAGRNLDFETVGWMIVEEDVTTKKVNTAWRGRAEFITTVMEPSLFFFWNI